MAVYLLGPGSAGGATAQPAKTSCTAGLAGAGLQVLMSACCLVPGLDMQALPPPLMPVALQVAQGMRACTARGLLQYECLDD